MGLVLLFNICNIFVIKKSRACEATFSSDLETDTKAFRETQPSMIGKVSSIYVLFTAPISLETSPSLIFGLLYSRGTTQLK